MPTVFRTPPPVLRRTRESSSPWTFRLLTRVPEEKRAGLLSVLAQDPRPQYQDAPERVYGMAFAGLDIRFRVEDELLIVVDVIPV